MSAVRTVPAAAGVQVVAKSLAQHMCPFVHEVDEGGIFASWTTAGATIELHSLRDYLQSFAQVEISHEELTLTVLESLRSIDGITDVSVESAWTTAGMEVTCFTSPTLVARR